MSMPFLMWSRALSRLPERAARRKLLPASACNPGRKKERRKREGKKEGRKEARKGKEFTANGEKGKRHRSTWLRSVQRIQVIALISSPQVTFQCRFRATGPIRVFRGWWIKEGLGFGAQLFIWSLVKSDALIDVWKSRRSSGSRAAAFFVVYFSDVWLCPRRSIDAGSLTRQVANQNERSGRTPRLQQRPSLPSNQQLLRARRQNVNVDDT